MSTVSDLNGLRSTMSHAALSAGLALSFAAVAQNAEAQQAPPKPGPNSQNIELETINVEGEGAGESEGETSPNTLKASTGIGRLPGSVQDTPQIINVIPKETLEQQKVTSLEQALRNAPGITTAIGEGNGGMNGDQFRIRGFEAKGDIFNDGLRDFGVYVRDSFNYENVQVLKGPSSESFGVGTTGGAINTNSKTAHLDKFYSADVTGGTGPLLRATFDANNQIGDTTAIRINGMVHEQDVADRDHVINDRAGLAAMLSTGIGTDQTWNLGLFYQHHNRTPDYGVPVIQPGSLPSNPTIANPYGVGVTQAQFEAGAAADAAAFGTMGRPLTEMGIDRSTFYGKDTDKDVGDVGALTSRFEKEVNTWLTVNNDTRVAYYTRDFATSVAGCGTASFRTSTAAAVRYEDSCTANFLDGDPATVGSFGGGNPGYFQESWGAQNILSATAEFETGFLRHELVVGFDAIYQYDKRTQNAVYNSTTGLIDNAAKGPLSIFDPVYESSGYYVDRNSNNRKNGESINFGVFASDRIWLTETFSVLGGVRWDYFDVQYDTYAPPSGSTTPVWTYLDQETDFLAPKASLIWEPTKDQTYYLSWATSASIAGQFPTNATNTLADPSTGSGSIPGYQEIKPEENESIELGGKIAILGGQFGISGAIFQVTKENAYYTDLSGDPVATNEKQRVQGLELGVSGNITERWSLLASYTYLDSEILDNGTTAQNGNVGNEVPFVADHAISFWSTYDIMPLLKPEHDGKLLVGGGVVWRDEVFLNAQNNSKVGDNFTLDSVIAYQNDKWRASLNGYNLTDELNYDGLWSNRVIPSSGRTFTLSVGATF